MVCTNYGCNSLVNTGSSNCQRRFPWGLAFGALASGAIMGLANSSYRHHRHHSGYNHYGHHGGYIYSDAFGRIERGGHRHYFDDYGFGGYRSNYYGGYGNRYWDYSDYYGGYGNDLRYLLDDITYGDYDDYNYFGNNYNCYGRSHRYNSLNCCNNRNRQNNWSRLYNNDYATDGNVINCENLNVYFVDLGSDGYMIDAEID